MFFWPFFCKDVWEKIKYNLIMFDKNKKETIFEIKKWRKKKTYIFLWIVISFVDFIMWCVVTLKIWKAFLIRIIEIIANNHTVVRVQKSFFKYPKLIDFPIQIENCVCDILVISQRVRIQVELKSIKTKANSFTQSFYYTFF